jgi:hypothetical protein
MQWPKISVVMPSLNQGQFLERAIDSVLSQNYPAVEVLIYDAGSTDNSVDVIKKFSDRIVFWVSEKDKGQSDAICKGWARSTGQILTWLNADDYYYPGALQMVGQKFRSNPECRLFCGAMAIVDTQEKLLRVKQPPEITAKHLLPWGTVPGQPAAFLHREVYEKLGGPRLDLHYVMDWELWLRIALNYPASAIEYADQILAGAREWPLAKTSSAAGKDAAELRRVLGELFAADKLPKELRSIEKRAYARSWWRQAESECSAGKRTEAFSSFKAALKMAPFEFSPTKIARNFWKLYHMPSR